MKTKFFLLAAAALSLAACTKTTIIETAPENAIGFTSYVPKATKATEVGLTEIQSDTDGFGVIAYEQNADGFNFGIEPNVMFKQKVTYATSAWTYTPAKFYDSENYYSFFAYYPYDVFTLSSFTNATTEAPSFNVTVPIDVTSQKDILAANALNQTNAQPGSVNFTFGHILSRICFKFKENASYVATTITVTSVKLKVPNSKMVIAGTYTYTNDNTVGAFGTPLTTNTSAIDYSVFSGTSSNLTSTAAQVGHFLMLIPQVIAINDLSVEISYTVSTEDSALNSGKSEISYTKNINLPAINWEAGKAYSYTYNVSLETIAFAGVDVTGWTTETNANLN